VLLALGIFGMGFYFAILIIPHLVILLVSFIVVVIIIRHSLAASFGSLSLSFALSFSFALAIVNVERIDIFDIQKCSWHGNLSSILLGRHDSIGSDSVSSSAMGICRRVALFALHLESATRSSGRQVGDNGQR
jgi:hypothetical protein